MQRPLRFPRPSPGPRVTACSCPNLPLRAQPPRLGQVDGRSEPHGGCRHLPRQSAGAALCRLAGRLGLGRQVRVCGLGGEAHPEVGVTGGVQGQVCSGGFRRGRRVPVPKSPSSRQDLAGGNPPRRLGSQRWRGWGGGSDQERGPVEEAKGRVSAGDRVCKVQRAGSALPLLNLGSAGGH